MKINSQLELMIKKKTEPKVHYKCENPKVSVIVPVYKVEKYLTQCIQSIVNQTLEEIEIIIIDEADQDRCREIIDFYEKMDPRIVAPHKKNGGYGASCNLGISMAKGEYIGFVESDDFIDERMYEDMYKLAKSLDADVVKTPFFEYSDITGDRLYYPAKFLHEQMPVGFLFAPKDFPQQFAFHPSTWSGIYKRDYLIKNNHMYINQKGASYVDCVFRAKVLLETERMVWHDQAYYHWRTTSEGSTTNNWNLLAILTRWNEVHTYLRNNNEKYDEEKIVPFMLKEEYLNTLGSILEKDIVIEREEWKLLSKNLAFITESEIKNAYLLSENEKKIISIAKRNMLKFKRKTRLNHILKKLKRMNTSFEKISSNNSLFWYVSIMVVLWGLSGCVHDKYMHSLVAFSIYLIAFLVCISFTYRVFVKRIICLWRI